MVGSIDGALHFYDSIQNNLNIGSVFSLKSSDLLNLSSNIGAYGSCSVKDIDNDGNLDLFIGQDLGGVFHMEHDANSSVGIEENTFIQQDFFLFPNPTTGIFNLRTSIFPLEILLFSSDGKELNKFLISSSTTQLDITMLSNGIYFLKADNLDKVYRIVKN